MINIKEITWTNFLGYGDYKNSISFDDVSGVCLIEGEIEGNENREEGDEKLNGAGKSSIIEAITWGLFGNLTQRENPGDRVIHWHTGKNCMVSIKTSDGYEITRMRKYNGLTELLVLKDGEDITRSTSAPAQEFIDKTFKIDYHTFMRSCIFGQKSDGFLELSDSKIRKVMESLMGISNLSPIVDLAKNKISKIDNELSSLNSKADSITNEIDRISDHIKNLSSKSDNFNNDILTEINEIKNDLDEIKEATVKKVNDIKSKIETKKLEKDSVELVDIEEITKEWENYEDNLKKYKINEEKQLDINKKISDAKSDIKILQNSINSIIINDKIDLEDLKNKHDSRNNALDKLNKLSKLEDQLLNDKTNFQFKIDSEQKFIDDSKDIGSICSKCRNKIDGEHLYNELSNSRNKIDKHQKCIDDISDKIDKIKKSKDKLKSLIDGNLMSIDDAVKYNNDIDDNISKKNEIDTKIKCLNNKIAELTGSIKIINEPKRPKITISEADTTNTYLNNIDESINSLKDRITEIVNDAREKSKKLLASIKDAKNKENPYVSLIKEQNKIIRELTEEKLNITTEKNKNKLLRMHIDYIRESYRNKKKIKAFWISELIPEFNKYLRYYLDYFEVDDKIEFDEFLSAKMDKWGYDTHSGGECKRIDLSVMFALNDLHASNFGIQSNFIILDEVDGRIDPFTMNKLTSLLSDDIINRPNGPTNIFVISHRKEMKDRFPNKIKVKNKQGRSYIINDGQSN